jgi:polyhydroxybutyrate depolymerase
VLPVDEVIGSLLQANRITSKPVVSSLGDRDPDDGCTNELHRWTNPTTGQRVALIKVIGGGHVVPGGRQYLPKSMIGPVSRDFDHADIMWKFFRSSTDGQGAGVVASKKPPRDDSGSGERGFTAQSEKALRERVSAMYAAMLAGDVAKCIELSDPQVVKDKTRDKAEQFFKVVIGLVKLARLGPNDRNIKSITPIDGGKAARVEVEVTKPRRSTSTEIWGNMDGVWYYRETTK